MALKGTWQVVAGWMFGPASAWREVADGWEPSWVERGDTKTQPSVRRVVEKDEEACACACCHNVRVDTKAKEGIVEVNT